MGKRIERVLLSYEESGGIVTVKYVERTYTDADSWLADAEDEEPSSVSWCNEVALSEFPNSRGFPKYSHRWLLLDCLFREGPLFESQMRAALDIPEGAFNQNLDVLLAGEIVYRDDTGIHIDAQWLENYIADFLAMPEVEDENI